MVWISPWDVFSVPPSLLALALELWVDGSEEDGVLGGLPFSPPWMLLMCPKDFRCVRERSVALALAANPRVELLGGKMGFPKLGGAGGRRCSLRKTEKTLMDYLVISAFLKIFFVIWRCTVLKF